MVSCSSLNSSQPLDVNFEKLYQKICVEGSGKGRLEFLAHKYPFTYESLIDRPNNNFNLAFDFPIVGEKKLTLSLDPKKTAQKINHSQMVRLIESQIEEREDKESIIESVEEFFVLTSEFVQFKALNKTPTHYKATVKDDHFLLRREHGQSLFEIDAFVQNEKYFERVILKVFPKNNSQNDPILSLFLIPEACEK